MIDTQETRSELALARGVLYRAASLAFRHPGESWREQWLAAGAAALEAARACAELDGGTRELADAVARAFDEVPDAQAIVAEHARVFGHVPRGLATPYETEWTGAAGDLLQYHQLSDIAAFYRSFGLRLGAKCGERADHASVELEFLQFLCVKEAWAEEQRAQELAEVCRGTQWRFLGEHAATWMPGLCARIEAASDGGFYARAAALLRVLLRDECARLHVDPSEILDEPSPTSFRVEDACTGCGHSATCVPGLGTHGDDRD